MREAKRNWIRWGWTLACLLTWSGVMILPIEAAENLQRFEFLQIRMGVPVRILLYAPDSASANQASDAAYDRLRQLDRTLSDYDPDSELMQLCSHRPAGEPVPVSEDLFTVLAAAKSLTQKTDGAFDVSVGPIVKLWRVARRKRKLPEEETLRDALARTGDQYVKTDRTQRTVTLMKSGMQLDFGGIAKGYAADQAYESLKANGLTRVLVAVAGDIRVGDPPPDQSGWRVEVEDKTQPPAAEVPPLVLSLANQAVSTSGDTYQYLEINGVRYSHIVDPQTGLGLTTPGSVTVIAPTGLQADGLASALSVLGPKRGLKLVAEEPQTEAIIIQLEENSQRDTHTSCGWKALLVE